MLEEYLPQVVILIIFWIIVYATMEVIKNLLKSLPDHWGRVFVVGPNKKIQRWMSFIIGYIYAWGFDFRFANMIFRTINGERASMNQHLNYLIVACLMFVGAKWIYKQFTAHYEKVRIF